ncbi:MAG: vitamin B12 dependent-methionine synthase activation domain-containing protein [bacterium]
MQILNHLSAEPDSKQTYARMGFKPGWSEIPPNMKELVKEAIQTGRSLLTPLACFTHLPIQRLDHDSIELSNDFTIRSRKVAQWMMGCMGIYLAAVTIGSKLDARVAELSEKGEITKAFLLNAYGAEAAEALMGELSKEITRLTKEQNFATTKRYSPGYGDWDISAQLSLLEIVQAQEIGIRLTEQYMMIPEKSVSAIIGVKPNDAMGEE